MKPLLPKLALFALMYAFINNIESNGSAAMVGALEYHATVEIYPKEQEV